MKKIPRRLLIILPLSFVAFFVILAILYVNFGKPWDKALFMEPVYKLDTTEKIVALTFDDGPSPRRTPKLLEVLDKHNVKASFFMIGGNLEKNKGIARAVVLKGHMVSNHSYSHKRMMFKTPWYIHNEISRTNELLAEIGVKNNIYFRPPNGKKLIILPLVLKSMNMTLVTGSYDPPSQYNIPFEAEVVSAEVLDNTGPGEVIFLHDGRDDGEDEFALAVDTIITELKKQGYTFVRLDEFIEQKQ